MMQEVSRMIEGTDNSPLRIPYVYAELTCGHSADVPLQPPRVRCRQCGHDGPWQTVCESCGSKSGGEYTFHPDPRDPEHRLLSVGDHVHCRRCADFPKTLAELRALDRSVLMHSRYRDWCGDRKSTRLNSSH